MRPARLPERRHNWNAGLRERFRQLEERWNQLHPPLSIDEAGRSSAGDPELRGNVGLLSDRLKSLHTHRSNVLVIGPESHITRVLPVITRLSTPPIESCAAGRLALPDRLVGTLVLRNADRLSVDEQQQLVRPAAQPADDAFQIASQHDLEVVVAVLSERMER